MKVIFLFIIFKAFYSGRGIKIVHSSFRTTLKKKCALLQIFIFPKPKRYYVKLLKSLINIYRVKYFRTILRMHKQPRFQKSTIFLKLTIFFFLRKNHHILAKGITCSKSISKIMLLS